MERRDILDKMIASKTLTLDGANYVRKCLDPFHDFEVRLDGLPDSNTSRVVIQEVTQSQTFAVPSGIAGNWDLHVVSMPDLQNTIMQAGVLSAGANITKAANQLPGGNQAFGLVTVTAVPNSGITFPNGSAYLANSAGSVFDFSAYFAGQKRLIALAFEVHDTTAQLYKQGACTVYRLPQATSISALSFTSSDISAGTSNVGVPSIGMLSRMPPSTLSEALLLPGARQWEASEGAYVVAVSDPQRNDLNGSEWFSRVYTKGDAGTGVQCLYAPPDGVSAVVGTTTPAGGSTAIGPYWTKPSKPVPFHTAGAYFTGLNVNATLTITVKAIFETAPTPDNAQLVVLAQPSPDYDPVAIELYKAAAARIPVGVPVGENASGDFWDKVLGTISEVAPILGSVIPLPGASIIGNIAGKAAKMGQTVRNTASERKQVTGNFGSNGNKNSVVARSK